MGKRVPNKVVQYAKEAGFYGASYLIDWNGYEVYGPEFSKGDDIPMIGMPQFILYKPGEIRFSSLKKNLHNNSLKYQKFYFSIYMKNPTTLIKAGEMEEQFVYFEFDDEEYTITINDTKNTYRYGIIPKENELEKFINDILNKFISSIQNKIMNE